MRRKKRGISLRKIPQTLLMALCLFGIVENLVGDTAADLIAATGKLERAPQTLAKATKAVMLPPNAKVRAVHTGKGTEQMKDKHSKPVTLPTTTAKTIGLQENPTKTTQDQTGLEMRRTLPKLAQSKTDQNKSETRAALEQGEDLELRKDQHDMESSSEDQLIRTTLATGLKSGHLEKGLTSEVYTGEAASTKALATVQQEMGPSSKDMAGDEQNLPYFLICHLHLLVSNSVAYIIR